MRALLLLLVACGASEPVAEPEILPPNTEQACFRAIRCGVFLPEQRDPCVACLEHVDPALLPFADDLPPLETVECDKLAQAIAATNLPTCVTNRWYGP